MSESPRPSDLEAALLAAIRHFFDEHAVKTAPTGSLADEGMTGRPLQLATAVLFLQMIDADQEAKHDEHEVLLAALMRVLKVDAEGAATVIRTAEQYVKTPLRKLLRLLRERCTLGQKKNVVESMWQLAFADAELAGQEEYFVRKVAEAIGLSTADLVETKVTAREAFLTSGR